MIGGGIFGLWSAWFCLTRGRAVTLMDRAAPGAGASGGPLGVLAPHAPLGWSPEKAAHLAALAALPAQLRALGATCGYGAVGRVQPLADASARARAEAQIAAAEAAWGPGHMWLEPAEARPGWVDPEAAACGLLVDRVTARLDPHATLAALQAAILARGGRIETGVTVTSLAAIPARHTILAAGAGSFPLMGDREGRGVKGQAARLDLTLAAQPVLYDRGLYVVVHADGAVAVGSTSEHNWSDPTGTDAALDAVLARARALCPAIRNANVLSRWAGLRPRARGGRPLIGAVPGRAGVIAATGGFKIGFALGAMAGEAATRLVDGADPGLPTSWQF